MKSGVYIITCLINNKHYIGYSKNITGRLNTHKSYLRLNKHPNAHLQDAFNLYGRDNFTFESLEYYPEDQMASFENWWCNMLNTHSNQFGFNLLLTNPNDERKYSEESKRKMSETRKGKNLTGKNNPSFGRKMTIEQNEANRLRSIGRKNSTASKERVAVALIKFNYEILTPNETIVSTNNLRKFSRENKLNSSSLFYTFLGKNSYGATLSQHKGYKIISKELINKQVA
jgi:group I intron endonuclease